MTGDALWWALTAFYTAGWLLYFRERRQYLDALTDLMCVMHDYDVDFEELRRTADHKHVREYWGQE